MNNLTAVEHALEDGNIWVRMRSGRWWLVRRNGATKTWKTRPGDFRIPIKAGLRVYGELTHVSDIGVGNPQDNPVFVVTSFDPNEARS